MKITIETSYFKTLLEQALTDTTCPALVRLVLIDLNQLAYNDGFANWEEMKTFFAGDFSGKIIFWDKLNKI